jgi:hypothetical protein
VPRAREQQHGQRPIAELQECRVEQIRGARVRPLEAVQHQQHRADRALGAQEADESLLQGQLGRPLAAALTVDVALAFLGESGHVLTRPQPAQRAEDVDRPLVPSFGQAAPDPRQQLGPDDRRRIRVRDAAEPAQGPRRQPEGALARPRLGAQDRHTGRGPLQQLVSQARLAEAGRCRH